MLTDETMKCFTNSCVTFWLQLRCDLPSLQTLFVALDSFCSLLLFVLPDYCELSDAFVQLIKLSSFGWEKFDNTSVTLPGVKGSL